MLTRVSRGRLNCVPNAEVTGPHRRKRSCPTCFGEQHAAPCGPICLIFVIEINDGTVTVRLKDHHATPARGPAVGARESVPVAYQDRKHRPPMRPHLPAVTVVLVLSLACGGGTVNPATTPSIEKRPRRRPWWMRDESRSTKAASPCTFSHKGSGWCG